MFDAIDVQGTASRLARVFFEKLWRYDQVVFDTSKALWQICVMFGWLPLTMDI